jgi:hypothetical protein
VDYIASDSEEVPVRQQAAPLVRAQKQLSEATKSCCSGQPVRGSTTVLFRFP